MRSTHVLSGCVLLGLALTAACEDIPRGEAGRVATTTSAPASRPASEIVLARIGDKEVITQEDFERNLSWVPPEQWRQRTEEMLGRMIEEKWFQLYVQEHPELVTAEDMAAQWDKTLKQNKVQTREELAVVMKERGVTLAALEARMRLWIANNELARKGLEEANDETQRRGIFDAHPDHFDDTRVTAKHILISVPWCATSAERRALRERLARIREDLVFNRRTWSQCVEESDCSTKLNDGLMGSFPRHLRVTPAVAEAAWSLKVGELSDIVESPMGFHLITVTGRQPGHRTFDDPKTKVAMQAYLQREYYRNAIAEMQKKYPLVGVQAPTLPPPPPAPTTRPTATRPARPSPATQPKPRPKRALRPASRPSTVRQSRPGAARQPRPGAARQSRPAP